MKQLPDQKFAQSLLEPPKSTKRGHFDQFLYAPYSRKIHRRVYCYSHSSYDLWNRLEVDSDLSYFNERPPKISISAADKITSVQPAFIAKMTDKAVVAHFISSESDSDSTSKSNSEILRLALTNWSEQFGIGFRIWTPNLLRENIIWLANIKQLLRYVSRPEYLTPKATADLILENLKKHRIVSLHFVLESIQIDQDEIIAAIVEMILSRQLYSDIENFPFGYGTELSIFHEFPKKV